MSEKTERTNAPANSDLESSSDWLCVTELSTHFMIQILTIVQTATAIGWSFAIEAVKTVYENVPERPRMTPVLHIAAVTGLAVCVLISMVVFCFKVLGFKKAAHKKRNEHESLTQEQTQNDLTYSWRVFDLAKTAYEVGHTEAVIGIIEKLHYDVNSAIPSNGLTLFLCACLSGKRELVNYMIIRGADVTRTTKAGDTALYLATFGVLSSSHPDVGVLADIIIAGCNVNAANLGGYTALHRAAGHGNLDVIQVLLKYGADPYQASSTGIYPIDSAINAGNLEAAELLKINISNPHVWDVVDPHTPPHIKMGLQSPQRKHLMESSRRIFAPRIL